MKRYWYVVVFYYKNRSIRFGFDDYIPEGSECLPFLRVREIAEEIAKEEGFSPVIKEVRYCGHFLWEEMENQVLD